MARRSCLLDLDTLLDTPLCALGSIQASARELLDGLTEVDLILVSSGTRDDAERRVTRAGLKPEQFAAICAPVDLGGTSPTTLAASHQVPRDGATTDEAVFVVSANREHIRWAAAPPAPKTPVVPIRVAGADDETALWEDQRAWFVARDLDEAISVVAAPRRPSSLSVILMAYNEQATIEDAIVEIRRFCQLFLGGHEIIVVDDGSSDETQARARQADVGDVRIIAHPDNRGMGASMRDGYGQARCDYVTSLPADRQVRAQSLAPFLTHLDPSRCIRSHYTSPHSGGGREIMSTAFRLIRQHLGGLTVDYAGAYIFHRRWLDRIDLRQLRSNSFVFSFELLQALRRWDCEFDAVPMRAFPRTAGASRVARPSRVIKVAAEVLYSRMARAADRFRS